MRTYKIKEVGKVITGKTPSTKNELFYNSKDNMFICPPDIKSVRYITNSEKYVSSLAFDSCKSIQIAKNSILIDCIGADLGNVAISTNDSITNQQINTITNINENIALPLYLYYFFSTKKAFFHLIGQNGSTMPIINKSMFENIEINIHDMPLQQHIVNTIGTIDDLIENKTKIINKLKDISTSLYLIYKQKESSNIKKLGDNCDIKTGNLNADANVENGKYKFFTCGSSDLLIDDYKFEGPSIIIAGNGEINVKYYDGKFNAYQRTYVLQPKENLYLFLKECELSVNVLKNNSQGSVIKFITKSMLENIEIRINDNSEIINNKIKSIYESISSTQLEINKLAEIKSLLLSKYF